MNIVNPDKKYIVTNKTKHCCQYHVIFCSKYRRKVLVGAIVDRLKSLIYDMQSQKSFTILEIEVMPDHVHLLIDADPIVGIYHTVSYIKNTTSRELRKEFSDLTSKLPCLWTRSKFISTVGFVSLEVIKNYIQDQPKA